ncbi:hypothetical protein GCM10020218_055170 [Dactylosporangium vinaceum]
MFQTLALFFFVGGAVTARGRGGGAGSGGGAAAGGRRAWLSARLHRLFRPVLVLVAAWSALLIGAVLWQYTPGLSRSVDAFTAAVRSRTVLKLVASPLWFLLVYAALTLAQPLVRRLHPGWPLAVVVAVDLGRFAFGAPGWIGWINLGAGWLVPYCLGAAWSRGRLRSARSGWVMLAGGLGAGGGADGPARVSGVDGRRPRAGDLQPEPADARGRRVRHRAVRAGAADPGRRCGGRWTVRGRGGR